MKKHLLTFGIAAVILTTTGDILFAQNDAIDPAVLARMAARRAAEEAGGSADTAPAPTPDTAPAPTPTPDAGAAPVDTTNTVAGDATATNSAIAAAEEAHRLAALKEAETAASIPTNLAYLQIIPHRNIFDPSRQPWIPNRPPAPVHIARVERFICTGTMRKIGKGYTAMFSGDGVLDYPPDLSIGAIINGFKIKDITETNVVLTDVSGSATATNVVSTATTNLATTNVASAPMTNVIAPNGDIVLAPTQGLTRSDGGPWRPAFVEPVYAIAPRVRLQADAGAPSAYQPQQYQPNVSYTIQDPSGDPTDPNAYTQRGRQTRGNRRGNANGGGFGGPGGGGFNLNGLLTQPAAATPTAPPDPAVLARLQARRAAEGQ